MSFRRLFSLLLSILLATFTVGTCAEAQTLPTYTIDRNVYGAVNSCLTSIAHQIAEQRRLRIVRRIAHNRINQGQVPELNMNISEATTQITSQLHNTAILIATRMQREVAAQYADLPYPLCLLVKPQFVAEALKKCVAQESLNQYWSGIQQGCSSKSGNAYSACQCIAPSLYQAIVGVCYSLAQSQGMLEYVESFDAACKAKAPRLEELLPGFSRPNSSSQNQSSGEETDESDRVVEDAEKLFIDEVISKTSADGQNSVESAIR